VATCSYTCNALPTRPPPGGNLAFAWDTTTCSYVCPDDCGVGDLQPTERCNATTCTVECAPGCGGCGFGEVCDAGSCACVCVQNATCAPGFSWDTGTCACAVDVVCPPTHVLDPATGRCLCGTDDAGVANCNGACGGATPVCQRSLCICDSDDG
jgi:hypothetical protein